MIARLSLVWLSVVSTCCGFVAKSSFNIPRGRLQRFGDVDYRVNVCRSVVDRKGCLSDVYMNDGKSSHQSKKLIEDGRIRISSVLSCVAMSMLLLLSPLDGNAIPEAPFIRETVPNLPEQQQPKLRYWQSLSSDDPSEVSTANEKLLDHAVGTINTMYYDNSAGFNFTPRDMYSRFKLLRRMAEGGEIPQSLRSAVEEGKLPENVFESRQNAVKGLKWLVSTLNDPFSQYLTREELRFELDQKSDGFLGLGAIVEPPLLQQQPLPKPAEEERPKAPKPSSLLDAAMAQHLPVITAITPDSPAERAGLIVNDRIVSVGSINFLDMTRDEIVKRLPTTYDEYDADDKRPEFIIAKPIAAAPSQSSQLVGFKLSRVKLRSMATEPFQLYTPASAISGGNSFCHYELLTPSDSIFSSAQSKDPVGYIRLTRFSKASTKGFIEAVEALEKLGTTGYILDVRNNYGGVIQEAMLTASTLLRDPHTVLCYTMNSRGGFTPHDVEEYIVDTRYPGYLLSSEPTSVAIDEVRRTNPSIFTDGWLPPSQFAPLHEQGVKRNTKPSFMTKNVDYGDELRKQKKIVILMNEGTASSAEVFVTSLRDNGRTVATVGAKTFGKGLIQHTFPMPDGGGLRLTVAEFRTPALKHVTNVGGARFDQYTGEYIGGGVIPDIYCESKGVPSNPGADICVGLALDALSEAEMEEDLNGVVRRMGGVGDGGNEARRAITVGIQKDDF